jgi:lipopolysaccharide/colanic/teichoic acid biosynthesis glycosyltransferase
LKHPGKEPGGISRPFEVGLALAGLALTAPLSAIAALLVSVTSRGPVFFRQERIGRFGRPFTLIKFRSMHIHDERGPQVTAKGDCRVTPIGRLLRKSKLDELPELWNVVQGHLSLVGPRPEVPKYVNRDDPLWQAVLKTRPGITDPVTLRLRNEEELLQSYRGNPEEFYLNSLQPYKLAGYVKYMQSRTWRSDLRVLYDSVLAVLLPARAPQPGLDEISGTN